MTRESFTREVAKRLFAQEIRDSDFAFRETEDQYAPMYVITPTGSRCNRTFLVGTLTERDNLGEETEYWRGRLVDPTGSILVYAGQYQPEAAQELARTEPPAFVAVVGKPSIYETDDGNRLISIRAEIIQEVDVETRDQWIFDTAKHTLDRLKAFQEFLDQGGPDSFSSGEQLQNQTPISDEMADVARAHLHYDTELSRYRDMTTRALKTLLKEGKDSSSSQREAENQLAPEPIEEADDGEGHLKMDELQDPEAEDAKERGSEIEDVCLEDETDISDENTLEKDTGDEASDDEVEDVFLGGFKPSKKKKK